MSDNKWVIIDVVDLTFLMIALGVDISFLLRQFLREVKRNMN